MSAISTAAAFGGTTPDQSSALAWTRSESGGLMVRPIGCGDLGARRAVASTILHENASNFHAESGLGHAAYAFPLAQMARAAAQAAAIGLGSQREPSVSCAKPSVNSGGEALPRVEPSIGSVLNLTAVPERTGRI